MSFVKFVLPTLFLIYSQVMSGQGTISDSSRAVTLRDVVVSANKVTSGINASGRNIFVALRFNY